VVVDLVEVTGIGLGVIQVTVLCGIFARLGNHSARLKALETERGKS